MREATKSLRRRWCEDARGVYPWRRIFTGQILDVGAGDDPLPFPNVRPFDTQDGDANHLSRYFPPESFDLVHASQCLEHMHNPIAAIRDWFSLVRPAGNLLCTFPDFDTYEKRCFPSRFNGDHKAVFSMWRKGFPGLEGKFFHVPTMLRQFQNDRAADVQLCRFVDSNFDWFAPEDRDQTYIAEDGVECWIEFLLLKL